MEAKKLIDRIKEEYNAALLMYDKTGSEYWSGRIALARELLNMVRKEKNINYEEWLIKPKELTSTF